MHARSRTHTPTAIFFMQYVLQTSGTMCKHDIATTSCAKKVPRKHGLPNPFPSLPHPIMEVRPGSQVEIKPRPREGAPSSS